MAPSQPHPPKGQLAFYLQPRFEVDWIKGGDQAEDWRTSRPLTPMVVHFSNGGQRGANGRHSGAVSTTTAPKQPVWMVYYRRWMRAMLLGAAEEAGTSTHHFLWDDEPVRYLWNEVPALSKCSPASGYRMRQMPCLTMVTAWCMAR